MLPHLHSCIRRYDRQKVFQVAAIENIEEYCTLVPALRGVGLVQVVDDQQLRIASQGDQVIDAVMLLESTAEGVEEVLPRREEARNGGRYQAIADRGGKMCFAGAPRRATPQHKVSNCVQSGIVVTGLHLLGKGVRCEKPSRLEVDLKGLERLPCQTRFTPLTQPRIALLTLLPASVLLRFPCL